MNFSSKLLEDAVEAFATLPGIGKKTALRLVLHLVGQDKLTTQEFVSAIGNMREHIQNVKFVIIFLMNQFAISVRTSDVMKRQFV